VAIPHTVAELGPGDSLGTGVAALLAGSHRYFALDVKKFASSQRNVSIFDQLVALFQQREPIPDVTEFPQQLPHLDSYAFPDHIITDQVLADSLCPDRLAEIRRELQRDAQGGAESRVFYFAPWDDARVVQDESVDFVFSQAVMEHVTDLEHTYQALWQWLKPGGWSSHVIDYRSHNTTREWNGHWSCSDFVWSLVRGKRAYLINRQPHSRHVELLRKHGFEIVGELPYQDQRGIGRDQLAPPFRHLSDDDLVTRCAFVQAVKRSSEGIGRAGGNSASGHFVE
jgi:SAM-dependent methyltransferase